MVESLPADVGDTGSCPGAGRSHMLGSGWAREPWPLSLRVRSLCSATGEATTVTGLRTAKKPQKTKQQTEKEKYPQVPSACEPASTAGPPRLWNPKEPGLRDFKHVAVCNIVTFSLHCFPLHFLRSAFLVFTVEESGGEGSRKE